MTTEAETALAFALIPVGATLAGGAGAVLRAPSPAVRSGIQHFAAGVVFAVVAVELLPQVRQGQRVAEVAVSFALEVAAMLGMRRLTQKFERDGNSATGWPWGLLSAVGVDLLLDGLLLGIGFAAGAKAGALLAAALAAECLSLGLATAATIVQAGTTRRGAMLATAGLAGVFALGAVGGVTLLHGLPPEALTAVVSFGCAALLYLVTEELLVEAHEVPETAAATTMFFAGFLLFLVLGMLE